MKRIFVILSLLVLLAACAPQEQVPEVTPAAQPAPVIAPQMPPEPAAEETMAPAAEETGSTAVTDVMIKSFRFNPPTIVIKAGDAVRWTNEDSARHDVTGTDWNGALLKKGESEELTFDKPGTYDYICSIHPYMKATVIVE